MLNSVLSSSRQFWLAGLGAVVAAQQEGNKLFNVLVKEGKTVEQRVMKLTDRQLSGVMEQASSLYGSVRSTIQERLLSPFNARFASPRVKQSQTTDMQLLTNRIDQLSANVKALSKKR